MKSTLISGVCRTPWIDADVDATAPLLGAPINRMTSCLIQVLPSIHVLY